MLVQQHCGALVSEEETLVLSWRTIARGDSSLLLKMLGNTTFKTAHVEVGSQVQVVQDWLILCGQHIISVCKAFSFGRR